MKEEKLYNETCELLAHSLSEEEWQQVEALRKQACENVEILETLVRKG